jgi:hypothetical protein
MVESKSSVPINSDGMPEFKLEDILKEGYLLK